MRYFQWLFNCYIKTSVHVGLAVCAFTLATFLEFNITIHYKLLAFIFFGTVLGYNFVKIKAASLPNKIDVVPSKENQWVATISFFAAGYFLLFIPVKALLVIALFGIITLLYALPFFNNKNLRSLTGLKIFIVGFVWAGVTVLVPWFTTELKLTTDVWLLFFQRFLWVVVLTIPFEIRDVTIDDSSLYTLPQVLGIKKTKVLGVLFLVILLALEGFKDIIETKALYALLLGVLLTLGYLLKSKKNQKELFASFWIEAIPIWYVFVFYVMMNYCPSC